ncbi:hypothetical protein E2C01_046949 [Portunus trituberculatus]|uniref:Uncharacterized protein n=1 Tax=Portunus trituberculatus TaxID=210409 RepID=A0A5B7G6L3_PORTR|nr:hypothetical protein [Portunus trituberculatus]
MMKKWHICLSATTHFFIPPWAGCTYSASNLSKHDPYKIFSSVVSTNKQVRRGIASSHPRSRPFTDTCGDEGQGGQAHSCSPPLQEGP